MPFAATRMDLEIIILSETSETEKDKYRMISLICGIVKKNDTNELIKNRNRPTDRKQTYGYQRVWGGLIRRLGLTYTHYCI